MSEGIRRIRPIMPANESPVTWNALRAIFDRYHTELLAAFDIRNPATAFADGLVANGTDVTVGTTARLTGRPASSIPTVLGRVSDGGRAVDQRFLPAVGVTGVSSVQDISPITASSGPSTATINIASHNVQADWGSIAYNSGSIAGLNLATQYYIYADDPDFTGGAVSYIATTTKTNTVSSGGRYFVGAITTPVAANTVNISAATSANPIAFTSSTNHGWSSGDTVTFAALPGDFGTNLNGNSYVITVTGVNTFTIAVNGAGYAAYTAGGTATRIVTAATIQSYGAGGGWLNFRVP